jgi:Outer membrane lipoprotein-sorting protein
MSLHLRFPLWSWIPALVGLALLNNSTGIAQDSVLARQRDQGTRLAVELRSQKPAENLTNSGTLRIRDPKGRRRELPVTIVTLVDDQRWQVRYEAHPSISNAPVESLTVSFTTNAPPRYELARSEPNAPIAAAPKAIDPARSAEPFAQTDFWFCDLGLEFLHWPDQRLIKEELSNGRLCWALDSYNPSTNGYASVRSWVDAEFHALLRAEAYDQQRRKVKEFSTGSFRQVTTRDGRDLWMLKDIRIRDEFRDTRTELVYDLPAE